MLINFHRRLHQQIRWNGADSIWSPDILGDSGADSVTEQDGRDGGRARRPARRPGPPGRPAGCSSCQLHRPTAEARVRAAGSDGYGQCSARLRLSGRLRAAGCRDAGPRQSIRIRWREVGLLPYAEPRAKMGHGCCCFRSFHAITESAWVTPTAAREHFVQDIWDRIFNGEQPSRLNTSTSEVRDLTAIREPQRPSVRLQTQDQSQSHPTSVHRRAASDIWIRKEGEPRFVGAVYRERARSLPFKRTSESQAGAPFHYSLRRPESAPPNEMTPLYFR